MIGLCQRLLLLLLLLRASLCYAQSSSFSFRTIGLNQGLSQSCVIDIAFDSLGFAWFATQDGLNRYDGKDFVVFPYNFDDITTHTGSRLGRLFTGANRTLWMITSGGHLEKMDLCNQHFTRVSTSPITALYEDSHHHRWMAGPDNGVAVEPSGPYPPPPTPKHLPPSVQQILEDKDGTYWFVTARGLISMDPHTQAQHTWLPQTPCSYLGIDRKGTQWLGTYGNGLYIRKKDDSSFHLFNLPADLIVEAVTIDRFDRVWIGTYGNGLYLVEKDRTLHFLAEKKNPFSLPYNDILCIREDPNGGIWIGTDGGGVAHYNTRFNNFELLARENVPATMPIEQVRAITTAGNGRIWIGTSNNGLGYADLPAGKFAAFPLPPYRKDIRNYERIVSLYTDKQGDCWVGTQGNGLLIVNGKTHTIGRHFHPDDKGEAFLPDHTIWCMLPDTGSRMWIGTRNGGLCLLDKEKGLIRRYDAILPENNVRALTRISDSLLCIGFENKGIRLFNTTTGRLRVASIPPLLQGDSFTLKCLYYQAPFIWIGALGKGLLLYDMATHQVKHLTEENGLPNNTIYGILPDHFGSYWMSTNKGICRFSPQRSPVDADRSNFTVFTREDGLQSNEFNTGAYHESSDGQLFFGGVNGLTIFHPTRLTLDAPQPAIVLTGIMINNMPLASDTAAPFIRKLDLSHRQNSLSFSFAALDFVAGNKTDHFYRLLPYDSHWIEAGRRNYAAYTNLSPGKYTFQAKAVSPFSQGDATSTSLEIWVHPPFWQTWWFIALCALSLVALLYAFYRYRITQVIRMQQIRHRIATDLHDDIGSALTNISLLSELSRKSLTRGNDAGIFLDRISEEVQSSGQALDDIVWSINTNNDTLDQMIARMRRYAAEIFDGADIRYDFTTVMPSSPRKLNMEQRRDCFLAFKEILNNIYKHAGARHVHIRLILESHYLRMQIADDGVGFDTMAVTQRNGLKNIRLRADKWQGTARIDSSSDGTIVALDFRLA